MIIKGIVHAHSTYSYDGKESLRDLKDFLMAKGISFCCVTEHTDKMTIGEAQMFVQECKALSGSQFVFVPGFEVPYEKAHILLIGTEVFLGQQADADMLKTWSHASTLTILAHPVRNAFKVDAVIEEVIDGIEIWNQQYDGKIVPRTRSLSLFKAQQGLNSDLLATGGTDFHRREHFGAPLYTIEVETLTLDAVLQALKSGAYTFGSASTAVASSGLWKGSGSIQTRLKSGLSIFVISLGKQAGAVMAYFGLRFPKRLKQLIRSRI